MARVPTWTELRLDAARLAQLQKECYQSVHKLLDLDLPELDRKITWLSKNDPIANSFTRSQTQYRLQSELNLQPPTRQQPLSTQFNRRPSPELGMPSHIDFTMQEPARSFPNLNIIPDDVLIGNTYKSNNQVCNGHGLQDTIMHEEPLPKPIPQSTHNARQNGIKKADVDLARKKVIKEKYIERHDVATDTHDINPSINGWPKYNKTYNSISSHSSTVSEELPPRSPQRNGIIQPQRPRQTKPQPPQTKITNKRQVSKSIVNTQTRPNEIRAQQNDMDWSEIHDLRLPLPLSYYFRNNRPDLALNVERRATYLRRKFERRKYLASTRIISSLEQIRLSSRNSVNFPLSRAQSRKSNIAPLYEVKCRLSEHEMKRLTAKTYKRLPEVKRRRREEVSNHLKVQNYKNRLEYGRKLQENRRHGIINYPLRSSCDDQSMTSSQSDFSLNGNGRSADIFKSDPYY